MWWRVCRCVWSVGARVVRGAHLAATSRVIAVCDTPACTFGLKLHAEVSQTAIMKPAVTASGRHWERRHGRHGSPLGVRREPDPCSLNVHQ